MNVSRADEDLRVGGPKRRGVNAGLSECHDFKVVMNMLRADEDLHVGGPKKEGGKSIQEFAKELVQVVG